jgi:hypothetical protein
MGLAGLLVVRPANFATTNSAYGGAADVFNAEATAALNEFDPQFNANPFAADPIDYHSTLFLLNGRTFDVTNPTLGKINIGAGDVLLLRYANLGTHDRGVTILNERQLVRAEDSHVLKNPIDLATKWMTPGQVSDAFISIDPKTPRLTQFPMFESGFHLNNGPTLGLGGAMTYLDAVKGLAGDPGGPVSQVTLAPLTVGGSNLALAFTGTQDLNFSANISASAGNLRDAEWSMDSVGVPGSGHKLNDPLAACIPSVPSGISMTVTCTIKAATLDTMMLASPAVDGDHIIWVHGQDASPGSNGWGVVSGDVFTFNMSGPDTGALSVHSSPTNGRRLTNVANGGGLNQADLPTADIVVLGTSAASLSDWVVLGGEYCLDPAGNDITKCPAGGAGTGVLVTTPAPLVGAPITPAACVPPAGPPGPPAPAPVVAAPGGGSIVSFCGVVPATRLASLPEGLHTIYFHAYEAPGSAGTGRFGAPTGRWGSYGIDSASATFTIDRTGPTTSNVVLEPNPNNGRFNSAGNQNFLDSLLVTATLNDANSGNSNVDFAEVFVTKASVTGNPVQPDHYGSGAEMIPTGGQWNSPTKIANAFIPLAVLTSYPEGLVQFWVHARDIAGNWGGWAHAELTLDRTAPVFNYPATPADASQVICTAGCTITLNASDAVSGGVHSRIVQAEWFVDPGAHLICDTPAPGCTPEVVAPGDPGQGSGTAIAIANPDFTVVASFTVGPKAKGTKIIFRVRDAANNWSRATMVITG